MYALAAALSIPFAVATAAITLWAGWKIALNVTSGGDALAWGLDVPGFTVLGFALGLVLWKFAAPALARETWPNHRATAAIFLVTWAGAIAANAGLVSLCGGTFLSSSIFGSTPGGLLDSQRPSLWLTASLCWLCLDAIVSLLPTALTNAAAWRRLPMIGADLARANGTAAPAPRLHAGLAPSAPLPAKDALMRLLENIAAGPSGEVCWGVRLESDGTIVTSQGALAHLLDVSKSTINRALDLLSTTGRITVCCSARETRITVVETGDAKLERSATNVGTA